MIYHMKFLVPFLAVAGAITDSGATDYTQGNAADAAALTIAADYMAALGPGPETGPVNRENGFRRINWDPSAASNAGVTQNSGADSIFPVRTPPPAPRPTGARCCVLTPLRPPRRATS